ncbi:MAG: ABC transporter permease subunit, partial [Candidatus Puniceispirillales bacterium]
INQVLCFDPVTSQWSTKANMPTARSSMKLVWFENRIWAIGGIDGSLIESARDLGASSWTIFRRIILPLSMPGVIVGAIFVTVMVLGEFATASALSGRKVNLLGNIIITQVGSLKWAFAAVAGVVLTVVMAAFVAVMLRIVNLRNQL